MGKLTWLVLGIGILMGLLAAGLILLISSPPRGKYIQLLPPPTPSPILVDISGAVNHPGLYTLPDQSRLSDVIQSAGGLSADADINSVNLAQPVSDGQKFVIPTIVLNAQKTKSNPVDSNNTSGFIGLININLATQEELDSLPGIGPTRALAIIEYRNKNGPFVSIEDLENVPGIGASTIEELKVRITVQ